MTADEALSSLTHRLRNTSVEVGIGLDVVDMLPGQVDLRLPLRPGYVSADGRIAPVVSAIVADVSVGVPAFAPVSESPSGVTVELRLDHVAALAPTARHLEIRGRSLGLGSETGTGRAEVRDDLGNLVAHAVGLLAIDRPDSAYDPGVVSVPVHPFDATRIVPVAQADGTACVDVSPGMLNRRGTVHGGVLMGLAGEAQELFLGPDPGRRRLQLSTTYLRPASGEGRLLLRSEFSRRGRRVCAVRTEIFDVRDKLVAVAHGTSGRAQR
ncbi:PaaI family thioesterase [Streptomyces sp. KL116D]|uniref:PaaI family thioesterase n=1 Tax=Streptomyces sp. KL116D TaxID=3045152 RepID=UPI0035580414